MRLGSAGGEYDMFTIVYSCQGEESAKRCNLVYAKLLAYNIVSYANNETI